MKRKRPEGVHDAEHSNQKPKIPDTIHEERLFAGVCVDVFRVPKPYQQVGAKADPFPADEHQQEIVRKNQKQHHRHEEV